MRCPKCQCEEISDSGICLWCGYQVRPAARKAGSNLPSTDPEKQGNEARLPDAQAAPETTGPAGPSEFQEPVSNHVQEFAPELHPLGNVEGRLSLFPRALAGLVDLAVIGLSTGSLILAAAFFSKISAPDPSSIVSVFVLFLLVFFLYCLVFLGFSNQTIGMMVTSLQLVGEAGQKHLGKGRVLVRSCCYLASFLFLGIGLIWAFFDRGKRCLHDRLTHTQVVRL